MFKDISVSWKKFDARLEKQLSGKSTLLKNYSCYTLKKGYKLTGLINSFDQTALDSNRS